MGKSLKDLFEISEEMDPKQEAIASILGHTIDADTRPQGLTPEEVERNEALSKLAQDLETGADGTTINTAKDRLRDILGSDTDSLNSSEIEEVGTKTLYVGKNKSQQAQEFIRDQDVNMSGPEKTKVADAIRKGKEGEEIEIQTKSLEEVIDDEGRMAKSELLKLTQYSAKLYKALGDNDQLPAWIQAKITLAADYIGTVKHYLEGEQAMGGHDAPQGQLEEAAKEEMSLEEVFNYIRKMIEEAKDPKDLPISIAYPIPNSDRSGTVQLSLLRRALEAGSPESIKIQRDDVLDGPRINAKGDRRVGDLERMEITLRDALLALEPEGFGENPEERYEDLDAEVEVKNDGLTMSLHIPALEPGKDAAASAKAKGDTRDVYESSLVKILSK